MTLPKTPSFSLDGKRALVAGATSGIGLACAAALAEAKAQVTLAARTADRLERLVAEFGEKGWSANALALDVADVEGTSQELSRLEPFDILVNSAGTAIHSLATETEAGDFDAVMDLNVRGAYFLTQSVAKGMIGAGKSGSIINISSQMAHVGGIERAVYCSSKFAVEGFTKAMAVEWGEHGIRINTICPTFIRTPLTEKSFADPSRRKWIVEKIKLGRAGEVEDVMGAVVYLASDASALVTGSSLLLDGGWTAD